MALQPARIASYGSRGTATQTIGSNANRAADGVTRRLRNALAEDDSPVPNVFRNTARYAIYRPPSVSTVGGADLFQALDLAIDIAGEDESVEEESEGEESSVRGVHAGDRVLLDPVCNNRPTSRFGVPDTPKHSALKEAASRQGTGKAGDTSRRLIKRSAAAQPKSAIALLRSAMRSASSLTLLGAADVAGDDADDERQPTRMASTRTRKSTRSNLMDRVGPRTFGLQSRVLPVGTERPRARGGVAANANDASHNNKIDRTPHRGALKSAWSSMARLVDSFAVEGRYAMSPGLEARIRRGENCDLSATTPFRPDNTGKLGHMVVTDLCYVPPRTRN